MLARRRILCGASAALAAAIIAAGCGGGNEGSTSTTSSEPLSKQELIAKGDAICQQARDRFAQLQGTPPTTPESAAAYAQKLITIQQTQLDQLRDLRAPSSLQSSLDDYLQALEKNIAILKQGLRAAQQSDATGYAKAQAKAVREQVQRLELARAVGFKECSRPAGTAPGNTG